MGKASVKTRYTDHTEQPPNRAAHFRESCSPTQQRTHPSPCTCHQAADVPGTKVLIDGHLALIPLLIPFPDGTKARPTDPLPLPGNKVRDRLLKDITTMAPHISTTLPPLHCLLPPPLWPETGTKLHYISNYAARITKHFYLRIVDKGVGVLWAFRRHWVWGVLEQFLHAEGYIESPLTPQASTCAGGGNPALPASSPS